MYSHTKFGIFTLKNIGDIDRTRKRDVRTDGRTMRLLYASQSSFGGIKRSLTSQEMIHIIWDAVQHQIFCSKLLKDSISLEISFQNTGMSSCLQIFKKNLVF